MNMVDNLIVQIKNGYIKRRLYVKVYNVPFCCDLLRFLCEEGFISSFNIIDSLYILVVLRYWNSNMPVIKDIQRVRFGGNKVYLGYRELYQKYKVILWQKADSNIVYLCDSQCVIVTTSYGLKTVAEAINLKCGGEVLVRIWV